MKKTTPFFCALIAAAIAMPLLHAEEGICHRCEVIREHNKTHPNNYEYYEDYLKAQGKGPAQTSDSASKNEKAAKKNSGSSHNNSKSNNKNNNNNNNNNNNSNSNNTNNSQNTRGNG